MKRNKSQEKMLNKFYEIKIYLPILMLGAISFYAIKEKPRIL